MRDQDLLQVDFMGRIDGVRSFEALRSRASRVDFGGYELLVADLADIIKSKRAADRPHDGRCWRFWRRRYMKKRKAANDEA